MCHVLVKGRRETRVREGKGLNEKIKEGKGMAKGKVLRLW